MTPGPWQAGLDLPEVANNNLDPRLVWADSRLIADCRSKWVCNSEATANARAIATVPDLLEALQRWEAAFMAEKHLQASRGESVDASLLGAYQSGRSALAKAGVTP